MALGINAYVQGREAIVTGANGIVYPGETIAADVLWRNVGGAWVAPRLRLALRESGAFQTWIEGLWKTSPGANPGASATVTITRQVPSDWAPNTTIDVRVEVDGVGPVWEQHDIFITGELLGEVEIVSVTPYVQG